VKQLHVAVVAARQALGARGEAVARALFYLAVLLAFSRLWLVLDGGGRLGAVPAAAFIWYIALTEWVVLSAPLLYLEIEEDVRRGDVAYRIARPVSYVWTKVAEATGNALMRLALLGVIGAAVAWLLAGGLPPDPAGLLIALPLGILALFVLLLWQAVIGLTAFWLQDAAPAFWIWQKLLFVLGGLMFPLEVYPDWLHRAAYWTPFAPMLHGWARLAFRLDAALAAQAALLLLAWGGALLVLVAWLYRRALVVLDVNGG